MGLIQKLFNAVLPASTLASMEAESRKWMAKCTICGSKRSIWEMGGIRYNARGSKTTFVSCDCCAKYRCHTLDYEPQMIEKTGLPTSE